MRRETHQIFLDPEELEIVQIHFVHGVEFRFELFRRAIDVRVVHVQQAHPHQSKQLAALLVAIIRPVFRQPQWQIAITARQRRKQLVMMRAVHRLEVVAIRWRRHRPEDAGKAKLSKIIDRDFLIFRTEVRR